MKPVQSFPGKINEFLRCDFRPMRHRIPAATLPYTYRKLSRNHDRIPSLNRKGCEPFFITAMTSGMSRNNRLSQSFLMTLLKRGVA
jgi:hypothetical protein